MCYREWYTISRAWDIPCCVRHFGTSRANEKLFRWTIKAVDNTRLLSPHVAGIRSKLAQICSKFDQLKYIRKIIFSTYLWTYLRHTRLKNWVLPTASSGKNVCQKSLSYFKRSQKYNAFNHRRYHFPGNLAALKTTLSLHPSSIHTVSARCRFEKKRKDVSFDAQFLFNWRKMCWKIKYFWRTHDVSW